MNYSREYRRSDAEIEYTKFGTEVKSSILALLADGMLHRKSDILGIRSNTIRPDLMPDLILRVLDQLVRSQQVLKHNDSYKIKQI